MANKYAVLVGCNYPNTENELQGCVNDASGMHTTLIHRFGFARENINLLVDTDAAHPQPTAQNIRQALVKMIEQAKPGDVLFFHYSGHGALIPKENNGIANNEDGYEECIVPCDINLITDEDFRSIVNKVPLGATFTMVSDSCHSGGLIDKEKEQIGPDTEKHPQVSKLGPSTKNKMLPLNSLLKTLREKTGNEEIEDGEIRVALFHLFGDEASCKFKRHVKSLLENLKSNRETAENGGGLQLLKKHLNEAQDSSEYAKAAIDVEEGVDMLHPDMGILLSGCQSNETSGDASTTGESKVAFGAFTNAIQTVLERHADPITNRDLVLGARKLLGEGGFSQHPCLYCSDQNAQAVYLSEKSNK
eukprot:Gb_08841 [translate_table: standard]